MKWRIWKREEILSTDPVYRIESGEVRDAFRDGWNRAKADSDEPAWTAMLLGFLFGAMLLVFFYGMAKP